jgi:hypothetical protein
VQQPGQPLDRVHHPRAGTEEHVLIHRVDASRAYRLAVAEAGVGAQLAHAVLMLSSGEQDHLRIEGQNPLAVQLWVGLAQGRCRVDAPGRADQIGDE